jgi:hypothetical protein
MGCSLGVLLRLAALLQVVTLSATVPVLAQPKYPTPQVVRCLALGGEASRLGMVPGGLGRQFERSEMAGFVGMYETGQANIPDAVALRVVKEFEDALAELAEIPEKDKTDAIAARLPACQPIARALQEFTEDLKKQMAVLMDDVRQKVAKARETYLDAQVDWVKAFLHDSGYHKSDDRSKANEQGFFYRSNPDRLWIEIRVTAYVPDLTEAEVGNRFCPPPEKVAAYCRLKPPISPLLARVSYDKDGKEIKGGPAALCVAVSRQSYFGPEFDFVPMNYCEDVR